MFSITALENATVIDLSLPGSRNVRAGESVDAWSARVFNAGFVPACGGTETWTRYKSGASFLYVVDLKTMETGWLGEDDIVREEDPSRTHA